MGTRAEKLAERIEQGAKELIAFIETCTDEEWQVLCPDEARSVAVVAHHVGTMYPIEVDVINILIKGDGMDIGWDAVDNINAEHAGAHGAVTKSETVDLIKTNSVAAAAAVRGLNDEQLDTVGPIALNWNTPLSTQFFIEEHAIGHSWRHLASIRAALGR